MSHKEEAHTCRLCLRKTTPRNSHIIPEFVYKLMYDDKHRYHKFSTTSTRRDKMEQKGLREKLLCGECEIRLSRYEKYASRVFDGKQITVPTVRGKLKGDASLCGIDYAGFKLFQLSVLWRAGVAKHVFFKNVNLGSHEEILRQMILQENPGASHQYGCLISAFVINGELIVDAMISPEAIWVAEYECYRFIFGGFFWAFHISDLKPKEEIAKHFLSESGELSISVDERLSEQFARELALNLKSTGNI